MNEHTQGRIAAVGAFRAITMFLMLFVNDIPSLKEIPHWLLHARADEDMLGFSDLIFPAFLFCMGMSVPFALQSRYRQGHEALRIMGHLFWRTVALVVMGLFTLNCGSTPGGLSYEHFCLLMVLGFFLVWETYPSVTGIKKSLFIGMRAVGLLLLVALIVHKDLHGAPFHTGWWGILGLIGWTYAVCAVTCLFARGRLHVLLAAWGVCLLLAVLNQSNLIPGDYAIRTVLLPFVPGGWTHHALGMSGLITGLLLQQPFARQRPGRLIALLFAMGIVMGVAALLCHPCWIISKIQATPTWLFYCLAIFFPLFGCLYYLTDVWGKTRWLAPLRPAGTATLTCYILPYAWYPVWQLLGGHYPELLCSGMPGLIRSLLFSLVIICLTGLLTKAGIKLKL